MPPSEFWGTDTWTIMDLYEGYAMSKGIKLDDPAKLSKDEIEELHRWMDEEEQRMAGRT